ncbi:hypothetical protein H5T58_02475, partial [Candidatus Parcubacteria bacterium]|nr:hypothetical protein [Candidatus Parcubacteria bacterium]
LEKEKLKETISLLDKKNFLGNQEFTLLRKDGKEKIVNTFWAKRKEKGYFLAMIDITSLKKIHQEMEEQINLRTKELREKLEELENFQKITIGRELKMVALKEEIQRLKKEIEELKKQREAN